VVQTGTVLPTKQDRARAYYRHIAAFLGRTEAEVREKAAALKLKIPDSPI
jgi:hypothetical protein